MNNSVKKYGLLVIKIIVGLAFLAAGLAKLAGAEMMVVTFEAIRMGQWFRFVTGAIEIACAALIFVPGKQAIGAGLLVCTMIGAVLAHLVILGPSAVPAIILGLLAAIIAFAHREQIRPAS
jgi:putative oxidoreductase